METSSSSSSFFVASRNPRRISGFTISLSPSWGCFFSISVFMLPGWKTRIKVHGDLWTKGAMRWILSPSLVFNCDCNQGSCVVWHRQRRRAGLWVAAGAPHWLWKTSVSEWGIKCSARCTLLPDVLSSSELLSNFSHNAELLSEVQSKMLQVQWHEAAFLRSSCTQSMPRFSDPPVLVSVLVSQWGDAVRTPFSPMQCVLGADRDVPSLGDSPSSRWACLSYYRGAQMCLQWMEMLPEGITIFPSMASCLVFITSMTSAGADAFKNAECFIYWGFMWFVTGRSQSFSSNYFLLIITTIILCLLFYDAT